jgi:hypothetical protein
MVRVDGRNVVHVQIYVFKPYHIPQALREFFRELIIRECKVREVLTFREVRFNACQLVVISAYKISFGRSPSEPGRFSSSRLMLSFRVISASMFPISTGIVPVRSLPLR